MIRFFRKKPQEKPIKKIKPVEEFKEVKEKIAVVPKKERKTVAGEAYPVRKSKISNGAYRILRSPHITEKATDLAKKNQYVFKISETANKTEIKKAIENLYGVSVLAVRIIKIPKKLRRLGKQRGWKKRYKKAIVKIKEGQKIEIMPR